ncbi:MFS transporter [Calditerricola satsumensis]|uniref:MFS transporter n=1 Tax=Calditerricola satsumensis TaxID=373054 RepID=A0A8J3BDD6_9BACI|nr:MFS transporter [Calditerricola satsumensis]GGK02320.1 MFS transporter [Calditerricola satsumensis]
MNAISRLERLPIGRVHYRYLYLLGLGWALDAMDVGLISFTLPAIKAAFNLSSAQMGLLGSAGLVGMFLGAAVGGRLADRYGRRAVVAYSLLVAGVGSLLTALAPSYGALLFFRFLTGIGLGAELPVAASLMGELVPSTSRGRFVVWLEAFWAVGWFLAALVGFLLVPEAGWRWAFVIGAIPALYAAWLRLGAPESPRWLAARGRAREAEALVARMEAALRGEGKELPEPQPAPEPTPRPYGDLFRPPLVRRTLFIALAWLTLNAGYYGAFIWLPSLLVEQGYSLVRSLAFVLIMTAAQLPGYLTAAWLVERWGRRPVLVSFLLLSALAALLFARSDTAAELLVFGASLSFFNLGAWGAIYAYTPELFPTALRTSGAGLAGAAGRLGGMAAPYLTGALLPALGAGGVLLAHGVLLAAAGAFAFLVGAETRGRALE